jgi:vanillate O-demethylase ferredoxin subunit
VSLRDTREMPLLVKSIAFEAPNIHSYDLRPVDGASLPAFTAGAHIDLKLESGLVRSYSLVNSQSETHRYVVAVQNDIGGRGGSRWIHENVHPGTRIRAAGPRNNFPLAEDAERSVFIAGGIGITPILSMIQRLSALRKDWKLFYCARSRSSAAFVEELQGDVSLCFDDESDGRLLDLASVVSEAVADGAHLYCCGPLPMLASFEAATAGLPPERVHTEYFKAASPPAARGGFSVVLARSAREIAVLPGKTILDALLEADIDVSFSCMEGTCGTCEVKVLEGIPDHRDLVLTRDEKEANRSMMVCCSGSRTARLVLDL